MASLPLQMDFPGRLIFGNGRSDALLGYIQQNAYKKVLLLGIDALQTHIATFQTACASDDIEVIRDLSIQTEPSFSDVRRIQQRLDSFVPDVVVGIGGGSVLDVAKVLAAVIHNTQSLSEIVGNGLLKERNCGLICIPATSGTGSEASPNAILIDDADGQKKGIISPLLVPDLVIVDPILTVSVPPSITAATGLDALTHCLEAYTNLFAKPFIDMYALEGIRKIAGSLVRAVEDGKDLQAKEDMALGSLLGGFCLGPVNTAAVHALAYPLSTRFHVPHGMSNAILLPHVMEFNLVASPKRYAHVAIALGATDSGDDMKTAYEGVKKVREIMEACKMPFTLRSCGVTREDLLPMAKDAMLIQRLLKNNPREVSEADAVQIYQNAL